MNRFFNLSIFIYFLSFGISLIIVSMFFSSLDIDGCKDNLNGTNNNEISSPYNRGSIYYFYDSDALTLPNFCLSVQKEKCHTYWNLGTMTDLFPSLLIYMLISIFTQNPLFIQFIYFIIQYLLILILINLLFRTIYKKNSLYYCSIANLALSLFLICPIYQRDDIITTNLFLPYHAGAFLNSLIGIILIVRYLKTDKLYYLYWLSVLVLISFFSDKIFVVYFVLPIILSLIMFLNVQSRKKIFSIILITVFSTITSWIIYKGFLHFKVFYISDSPYSPNNVKQSFNVALGQFIYLIKNGGIQSMVYMLSYLSIIGSIIISAIFLIKRLKSLLKNKTNTEINYFEFYNYYFTIVTIGSIAAPIVIGVYYSEWQIRYCIFPFYLGIMNIIFFISYLWLNRKNIALIKYISTITILLFIIYISINYNKYKPFSVVPKIGSYYPAVVKATDELSLILPLKNGIGDYWDAKHISLLSKKNITVNTVFPTLHGWFHTNNLKSYYYNNCNDKDTVFYNFIVLRMTTDTSFFCKFFGDNFHRIYINGYKFYVVPDFYFSSMTGMATLINYKVVNPFMKKVTDVINYIKTDKKWYKHIEEKAKKRNIPVDSMLILDGIWVVEQGIKKK